MSGRTGDERDEVPLSRAFRRAYVYYRKGAIVMYAIRDRIGESAFHRALHDFYAAESGPGHHATSGDLIAAIERVAPPAAMPQIDEWTKKVVIDDLALISATSHRLANGNYDVTLGIRARNIPGVEPIDVAVYAADGRSLHLAKHDLHDGMNTVTIVVAQPPASAAVDPSITRLDRDRFDNERAIRMNQ
jgi:aminopeptidase N